MSSNSSRPSSSDSAPLPPAAAAVTRVPSEPADQPVGRFRHEALAVVLRITDGRLTVLGWQRGRDPFSGAWAVPSGPLTQTETVGAAATRYLAERVDLTQIAHLEQLETRSEPGRDPFDRTIATAYLGLVPADVDPRLPDNAAWLPTDDLPPMAFDHESVIKSAVERLRSKLSYTNLGFALAPREFTISELRQLYVAALGHDVSATNLQRVLTRRSQLEPTGSVSASSRAGGRPAKRFRFVERSMRVTDPFAALRP